MRCIILIEGYAREATASCQATVLPWREQEMVKTGLKIELKLAIAVCYSAGEAML